MPTDAQVFAEAIFSNSASELEVHFLQHREIIERHWGLMNDAKEAMEDMKRINEAKDNLPNYHNFNS